MATKQASNQRRGSGGKPGRKLALLGIPPQAMEKMLTQVRGGGSPWVAAKLIGIDSTTFHRYMTEGRREDCPHVEMRKFYFAVSKAYAACRLDCESRVTESNPEFWLTRSPGGRTLDPLLEPGWTDPPKEGVQINIDNREQSLVVGDSQDSQAPLVFSQAMQVLADLGLVTVDPKLLEAKPVSKVSAVVPRRVENDTNGYAGEPFVN